MAFWNKKKPEVEKQLVIPNLPIIEALGKLSPTYRNFATRAEYSKTFSEVSEVYSVVMYLAKAFSNMRLELFQVDAKGSQLEEIKSHDVLDKLSRPNPLNNWTDFLINYYVNKKVQGNSYILRKKLTGFEDIKDTHLWVLPAQYTYVIPKTRDIGTYWSKRNADDFIKGYAFYFSNVDLKGGVNWKPDEIMHTKEPNLKYNQTQFFYDLLNGMSPLDTLVKPIENISKAYEAQNVILNKRGALGIISPEASKDITGNVSIYRPTDKKDLQEQFEKYGLGSEDWQFIISNTPVRYQQMAVQLRELQLFEGIKNNAIAICNTYNFPIVLLNYLEGGTFNNVNELKKSLYQDNIIPEANAFVNQLNNFLGLSEQGLMLKPDFSHIPILQEDAKKEAEKDQITVNTILSLQNAVTDGIMSIDAASTILTNVLNFSNEDSQNILTSPIIEDSSTDTGGIPPEQLQAQANLRGTVGGVQGILAIQDSVARGITNYDAALATLVEIYGFNEETTRKILGKPNNANTNTISE